MRNFNSLQSAVAWRCGAIVALVMLACQHKSPEQELIDKAGPAGSWIATLQMAGETWNANSVPASFVQNALAAADEEFETAADEASKSQARPEVRDSLRQILSEARAAGEGLRRAVEAGDRPGVSRVTARLAALRGRFEALKKGPGAS